MMKKLIQRTAAYTVCAAMCVMGGTSVMAYKSNETSAGLIINEEWVLGDQKPIIVNDRTLAPLRVISEKLGFVVDWDENERKVTMTKDDVTINMFIDETYYLKNGEREVLDTAPTIFYDTTMVPVRAIAEAIGCDIEWNGNNNIVMVDSPNMYKYYSELSTDAKSYSDGDYVVLSGYVDEYKNYLMGAEQYMTRFHFVPDYRIDCKLSSDTPYSSVENVKRVELVAKSDIKTDYVYSSNDLGASDKDILESYAGKRVIVKGKINGTDPYSQYTSALLRITIDSIEVE